MAKRLDGLDALRGMAAIAVLVFHTVALLQLWPAAALPLTFNYLSLAVQLFFALSAFSLCIGYFGSLSSRADIAYFWQRRILRIAPLFYFVLSLYLVRRIVMGWGLPGLDEISLNLLFLFSVVPGYHESLVPAGWSIGIEMAFYVLFPAFILVARDVRSSAILFVLSLIASVFVASAIRQSGMSARFDWMNPVVQLPYFLVGILMYHVFREVEARGVWVSFLSLSIAALLFCFSLYQIMYGPVSYRVAAWPLDRHVLGVSIMPLVLFFAMVRLSVLVNRVTVYIGAISYGIYLLHPFVITVIAVPVWKWASSLGYESNTAKVGIVILVALISIAFASATFHFLERPCTRIRVARSRRMPVVAE